MHKSVKGWYPDRKFQDAQKNAKLAKAFSSLSVIEVSYLNAIDLLYEHTAASVAETSPTFQCQRCADRR